MADDRHYVGGQWYRICDRTGFKIRDTCTKKEWNNRIVREQSWEPRQPQDFVQGIADDQTVVDARPRQLNEFQGPLGTTIMNPSPAGAEFIVVQSTVRMVPTDVLAIMLDTGENFYVQVGDVLNNNLLKLALPLPYSVSSGNVVIDTSAMSNPVIVAPAQAGI